MTRELKNSRESYSLILLSAKDQLLSIFSKIKNHQVYRNVPVCVYTEDENIDPLARTYLREYTNVFIIQTLKPPYGVLERICSIFTSREDSPFTRDAIFQSTQYAMQEGNYHQALQSLSKIPDLPKLILRKMILKLSCFFEMGAFQEALELLERLEGHAIISPSILWLGALIHEHCGHKDEVQRFADRLLENFPGISETMLVQVEILKRSANIEEIKRLLFDHFEDHALARDKCFQVLVSLCLEKREYEQLIDVARWSSHRFNRTTGFEITRHASELHQKEQTERAIEILENLHHFYHEEDQWIPLYHLGLLLNALGRHTQAAEALSLGLATNPRAVEIVQTLVETLPKARKEKRHVNQLKLKNAIRKRIIYLNRKLDVRMMPTEENAFRIYPMETVPAAPQAA